MNERASTNDLPAELIELGRCLAALPDEHAQAVNAAYRQACECVQRRQRILALVQEALAQLRLDVKYLMFDLDATRRERDKYLSQLEHAQGDNLDF